MHPANAMVTTMQNTNPALPGRCLISFMDVMGVVLAAKQEGKDSSLIRFSVRWNDSRGSKREYGVLPAPDPARGLCGAAICP
jgi:peptide deformylase